MSGVEIKHTKVQCKKDFFYSQRFCGGDYIKEFEKDKIYLATYRKSISDGMIQEFYEVQNKTHSEYFVYKITILIEGCGVCHECFNFDDYFEDLHKLRKPKLQKINSL